MTGTRRAGTVPDLLLRYAVPFLALVTGALGALPWAGGWNDGSRLATAESLVDRGTLAIDASIFVEPATARVSPYTPGDTLLATRGTRDRIFVNGHFFTDKPPLPAVAMAGFYWLLQKATGLTASSDPRAFCRAMAIGFAGVPFAVSVWAVQGIAFRILRDRLRAALLAASFAFATIAPAYSREVNGHVLQLALIALLLMGFLRWESGAARGGPLLAGLGLLLGAFYAVDTGLGGVAFLVAAAAFLIGGCGASALAWLLAGAAPLVVLHHAVTWWMAGTLLPPNLYAANLSWPGSPFDPGTMTGPLLRRGPIRTLVYALELLFGKKGFVLHNPPLLLAVAALPFLVRGRRSRGPAWGLSVAAVAFLAGGWALYSVTSTNASGVCVSVRWFLPFLPPGMLLVAVALRERPDLGADLALLSAWGAVFSFLTFWEGPWMPHMVPGYWFLVAGTLLSWAVLAWRRRRGALAPGRR